MTSKVTTVVEYLAQAADDKAEALHALHNIIVKNLPKGFEVCMNYGMIGYVVPHSLYPKGYHCNPKLPLPFMGLAAQKNSVNFYHMGIYADKELYDWFTTEHAKTNAKKLDIGKSCTRYKNLEHIPLPLVGKLVKKITVKNWIDLYESAFIKK